MMNNRILLAAIVSLFYVGESSCADYAAQKAAEKIAARKAKGEKMVEDGVAAAQAAYEASVADIAQGNVPELNPTETREASLGQEYDGGLHVQIDLAIQRYKKEGSGEK